MGCGAPARLGCLLACPAACRAVQRPLGGAMGRPVLDEPCRWRVSTSTIYHLVPAWWFIALLLQLYLVFPLLYRLLDRLGSRWPWLLVGAGVAIKLGGLLVFDDYLDAWSRGAIFLTRLPEFALGMLVALWLSRQRNPLLTAWALALAILAIRPASSLPSR